MNYCMNLNRKKWVQNPFLNYWVQTIVYTVAGVKRSLSTGQPITQQ